ncbi:MAG: hypothetical protein LDLANPLL_02693 [Turneriella sp.]|nr:hypothetical protein [Turneriella sp.]
MDILLKEIRACTVCAPYLPLGPNPVTRASEEARILIIGQAPGIKVHTSGLSWNDASGERLRSWLNVPREIFYNEKIFAIMSMGFCYPGRGKSGDNPPRSECAPLWHTKFRSFLPNIRLTILIGSYAIRAYLPQENKLAISDILQKIDYVQDEYIALVHPSPRNQLWLKTHPWFEEEIVPQLQRRVGKIIGILG